MNYFEFRDLTYQLGIFSIKQINLIFSGFNKNNLLYWQKKAYLLKLRNGWYCHTDFIKNPEHHFIIANCIYEPSYISHLEALMYYGMIPEHITNSTSITTKKTNSFEILGRNYTYYSIKKEYFFGYSMLEINVNGIKRSVLMASREKALLDLLYNYTFYQTKNDVKNIRLNEIVLEKELNWNKLDNYLERFKVKALDRKIKYLKKIVSI